MTDKTEFSPEMTDEQIIESLAAGDEEARKILAEIADSEHFRRWAFDLNNMQMSGKQIVVAFKECASSDRDVFCSLVEHRSSSMIDFVNHACAPAVARTHGPLKTRPKALDEAMHKILVEAEARGDLELVSEAEAKVINAFFTAVYILMRKKNYFLSNYRLNTGMEDEQQSIFLIRLVEIIDKHGKTVWSINPLKRKATPEEINQAFEAERKRLGRPMTFEEIQALDAALAQVIERDHSQSETKGKQVSQAVNDVVAERQRQQDKEGWTLAHDDQHTGFELTEAAAAYANHVKARAWLFYSAPDEYRTDRPFPEDRTVFGHGDVTWPKGWSWEWWKPKDPRRDLVRAAALIIADIERLDRLAEDPTTTDTGVNR